MGNAVHKYQVSNDFLDFVNLPRRLYRGDPYYMGREERFSGEKKYIVIFDGENSLARCCAIINPNVSYKGYKTGMIGFYESFNNFEANKTLFDEAIKYFKEQGVEYIVAPMNGSVWNNFRITVPKRGYPEFFLENYHKPYYKEIFENLSFTPIKKYISTLYKNINIDYSRCDKFEEYYKQRGVTIRTLNMENFEEDLKKVFNICLEAYKDFALFFPVTFDEFYIRYLNVRPLINPEYMLIAEKEGVPCAFIFAINNLFESIHFTFKKTLIIRHLASDPKIAPKGLGTHLAELMHQIAYKKGFDEIIHSMMDVDVPSKVTYSKGSEIIREYNLYGLKL